VTARRATSLQFAAAPICIVAYAALCHYTNSVTAARALGAALALAPVTAIAIAFAWRRASPLAAFALLGAMGLVIVAAWPLLEMNFSWVYLLEECSLYGLLAFGFARSLLGGRVAVCTVLADKVHGPLTASELRYTRRITAAWALFFALVTSTTLGLFILAPLRVWSLFSNFCTLPLVLLMFIGEYAVRRRALPKSSSAGLLATLRVYFAGSA
jgi:uncharacterized membrane protein